MKKIFSGITVALLVVLMVSGFAFARGRGDNNYGKQLTGKTVDMSGTIQAVDFTPPQIEIKIDVDGKIIEVELGPVWQYDPKDFQIGASISLTGEYVANDVFLPYSFKVNDKTYELRDTNGNPLWVGGKNNDDNRGNRNQDEDWDCRGRGGRNQDSWGRGMMRNR